MANVIISRIQNRRGLKQDLPQPLRPGELGFAVDSRQLFIGADPDDDISGNYNKISFFESTTNSKTITQGIANNNLISFTIPYKKFPSGTFDGVTKTAPWALSSNTYGTSGLAVFAANSRVIATANSIANVTSTTIELDTYDESINVGDRVQSADIPGIVSVAAISTANSNTVVTLTSNQTITTANTLSFVPDNIVSTVSNAAFTATDLTVLRNSVLLLGDNSNVLPAASKDYSFSANTLASNSHIISFRNIPNPSDEITVAYYSNAAILHALSNANTESSNVTFIGTIYAGTDKRSFYTAYNIPTYRQINPKFVTVCAATGTGLIGLEQKHIAVTADSTLAISSPANVVLGNLLVSRTSEKIAANTVNSSNTTLVFNVGLGHPYSVAGPYNYVYVNDTDGGYLDGRLFQISANTSTTCNVAIPSNASQTAREVTANVIGSFGANTTIKLIGNIAGMSNSDIVYLDGNSSAFLNGNTFLVSNVNAASTSFTISGNSSVLFAANITSNLRYMNFGANLSANTVQIFSPAHGFDSGESVLIASSSNTSTIPNVTEVISTVGDNTFFITASGLPTSNVTMNISPSLAAAFANTFVTPVRSIDLSSQTTVSGAIAVVNALNDYPQLNFIPDTVDTVYFTHKAAFSSVGLDFGIHEDPDTATLSVLKLTPGLYTTDSTVKAKLEKWLNSCLESEDVNIFTSAKVGEVYSTDTVLTRSLGTYTLNIDNTFDEITFDHRDEARDFNSVVNDIYFQRTSRDIRGLVNLKTNIELQTKTAAVIGDRTVSYTDTNTASIAFNAANAAVLNMQQSISVYDSYIIDYTITEASTETSKYQRMGTMHLSGRSDFLSGNGSVLFQDISSEMLDTGLTGNLILAAHMAGNTTINIHATNNLSPSTDLEVKYIVRRWSSLPA